MVDAVHEPGRIALQLAPVDVRDTLVQPEGRYRADVLVGVRLQRLLAQGVGDVVAEDLGLAYRVLGVGRGLLAGLPGGDVGDGGCVSRRPRVRGAVDGQFRGALEAATLVAGRSVAARIGCGLRLAVHTTVRVEAGSVAEDGDPVRAGVETGLEAYVDVAAAQLGDRVLAHLLADLGRMRFEASTRIHLMSSASTLW